MSPPPIYENDNYISTSKVKRKGRFNYRRGNDIGKDVSINSMKEGLDNFTVYLNEHSDIKEKNSVLKKKVLLVSLNLLFSN